MANNCREICGKCNRKELKKDKVIQCKAGCDRWFHIGCVDPEITGAQYRMIHLMKGVRWGCSGCREKWIGPEMLENLRLESHRELERQLKEIKDECNRKIEEMRSRELEWREKCEVLEEGCRQNQEQNPEITLLDVQETSTLDETCEIKEQSGAGEPKITAVMAPRENQGVGGSIRQREQKKVLILGDSTVRGLNGDACTGCLLDVRVYPGIGVQRMRQVVQGLRQTTIRETSVVIIHVGTNDITRGGLGMIRFIQEAERLVRLAVNAFGKKRVVLSGILLRKDMQWRRIGEANHFLWRLSQREGVLFVDGNSWLQGKGLDIDGLHLKVSAAQELGRLFSRVADSFQASA